jgi:superfamily I DNA and/or RNA helicase
MLEVQYRMHEKIMSFSNEYFYHSRLQAHASVAQRTFSEKLSLDEGPLVFIDTAGAGYEEHQNESTKSTGNAEEAKFLIEHLKELAERTPDFKNLSVGIITPYQEQLKTLNEMIQRTKLHTFSNVEIGTVDSFQGQERDIIYISLVRSNSRQELGFLKEYRRMNVALTRAKQKLIVIGDSVTLGRDSFYKQWVSNVVKNGRHLSVYEYLVK